MNVFTYSRHDYASENRQQMRLLLSSPLLLACSGAALVVCAFIQPTGASVQVAPSCTGGLGEIGFDCPPAGEAHANSLGRVELAHGRDQISDLASFPDANLALARATNDDDEYADWRTTPVPEGPRTLKWNWPWLKNRNRSRRPFMSWLQRLRERRRTRRPVSQAPSLVDGGGGGVKDDPGKVDDWSDYLGHRSSLEADKDFDFEDTAELDDTYDGARASIVEHHVEPSGRPATNANVKRYWLGERSKTGSGAKQVSHNADVRAIDLEPLK